MNSLDQIALKYRTDKGMKYHGYTNIYEHYFHPLKDKPIVLLELGIGSVESLNREGESILMFREYFSKGKCYAIDNDPDKVARNTDCFLCDQTDEKELTHIISVIGNPCIIIDDASHIQKNTIKSFEILFPLLKSGGYYCIEDSVTAYWPSWGGDADVFNQKKDTIVTYMVAMCHYINLKRQETFNPPQNIHVPTWIQQIDSIHFHHSQIIIKKK